MKDLIDVIIVGAGPAGLSSAIYVVRSGKTVLLLEAMNYGGQIVNTPEVENYPAIKKISGFEFATTLYEQAMELGAELEYEKVVEIIDKKDVKTVVTEENEYNCKSVIIATGAKNRTLGIDREEMFIGRGVSYCATCDGVFFKGKDVAVVGGGNTALEDAGFLSNYCNKVYLIHRRDEFRGEHKLVEELKEKSNIEFVLDSKVTKINGEMSVSSIIAENVKSGEEKQLDVSGIFVAIGQVPQNDDFANLIKIDSMGYVVATEDCKTNVEGIFVAGDCRTKAVRQLATAVSDGAVAGLNAVL